MDVQRYDADVHRCNVAINDATWMSTDVMWMLNDAMWMSNDALCQSNVDSLQQENFFLSSKCIYLFPESLLIGDNYRQAGQATLQYPVRCEVKDTRVSILKDLVQRI